MCGTKPAALRPYSTYRDFSATLDGDWRTRGFVATGRVIAGAMLGTGRQPPHAAIVSTSAKTPRHSQVSTRPARKTSGTKVPEAEMPFDDWIRVEEVNRCGAVE